LNQTGEYKVKLDLFEGPLDLLLYLVRKAEVDIVDISVSEVAKQYLEYLDIMRDLNINIASEYLSMASTLVRLKAQELLPDTEVEAIEDEEGIYNREQLIEKLLEYKTYKEAAGSLRKYEAEQYGSFSRGKQEEVEVTADNEGTDIGNVSVFDLIAAFKRVLLKAEEEKDDSVQVVERENIRLDDRIEHVIGYLEDKGEVPFEDLFKDDLRKLVLIVTFMAILELVKMRKITFRQESGFGKLFVKRRGKNIKKE
jgi:segregation and condensation protein A